MSENMIYTKLPFAEKNGTHLELSCQTLIYSQDFYLEIKAKKAHTIELKIANFSNAVVNYSYKVFYADSKKEDFIGITSFNNTKTIKISKTKQIRKVIFGFHIETINLPFKTAFNLSLY